MSKNILDLIGNTPLVTLRNIESYRERIFLKLEKFNPGGSVKDRSAKYIIDEAEKRGLLKSGGTIIESSSGNFGIALAMIGAVKGYKVKILVDPKTTQSNIALLRGFGAEVIVVTEKDDSGSYHKTRISLANKMASEIENSFRPDQCFNLLNSQAHYESTAKEILNDLGGELGAIVIAVSTGGQIGGISKFIKNNIPGVKIIGVDAVGSTIFGGNPKSYLTPGIGLSWTPKNVDINLVDEAYLVPDEISFLTARTVARYEGIMIGPSSGACLAVSMKVCDELAESKKVVCMVADGGDHYINTLFSEKWLQENNLSTDISIEKMLALITNISPVFVEENKISNYNSEIDSKLEIPQSTIDINNDILKIK